MPRDVGIPMELMGPPEALSSWPSTTPRGTPRAAGSAPCRAASSREAARNGSMLETWTHTARAPWQIRAQIRADPGSLMVGCPRGWLRDSRGGFEMCVSSPMIDLCYRGVVLVQSPGAREEAISSSGSLRFWQLQPRLQPSACRL